ncbi:MAG TPA: hypothetical protein VIT43_03675 [Candidatus Dormibacteraeota bacterium]
MRRFRVAAAAVVAGLAGAISFGDSASATTVSLPGAFPATRIALVPAGVTLNPTTTASATLTAPRTVMFLAGVTSWTGKGVPKVDLTLRVLSGPDGGKTATATTDNSGLARLSYNSGSVPGTDVVQATFSDGLEVHKSNRPFINLQTGPPAAAIRSPASLTVTPTCFQPAGAVAEASDNPKSPTPRGKSATLPVQTSTITVNGTDFNPFSAVLITFDAGPGGHPQSFEAGTDPFGSFSRQIQVTEPAEGTHIVRADDFRQREAQATYTLPCSEGTVALDPPIGPPGFVTLAVGRGFPPNSPITLLNWSAPDIPSPFPKIGKITTLADGTFQYPVLILYHDELGFRTLRAVVQDANPGEGNALIEADAPFFVTLGRAQPDDLVLRR